MWLTKVQLKKFNLLPELLKDFNISFTVVYKASIELLSTSQFIITDFRWDLHHLFCLEWMLSYYMPVLARFLQVMENLPGKSWNLWFQFPGLKRHGILMKVMEKQYAWIRQKDKKFEKITDESKTGLISVEIKTSTYVMPCNAGKYVIAGMIILILLSEQML